MPLKVLISTYVELEPHLQTLKKNARAVSISKFLISFFGSLSFKPPTCANAVPLRLSRLLSNVAEDGTAFEVKDPRRLEQDILPKYFRHSRFQSLVRQLNFYSFKKISKVRC